MSEPKKHRGAMTGLLIAIALAFGYWSGRQGWMAAAAASGDCATDLAVCASMNERLYQRCGVSP